MTAPNLYRECDRIVAAILAVESDGRPERQRDLVADYLRTLDYLDQQRRERERERRQQVSS
jgi:hypothetical protein